MTYKKIKKNIWLRKSTDTGFFSLNFQNKIQNIDPRIKFIETWISY